MSVSMSHLLFNLTGLVAFCFCFHYEANLFDYSSAPESPTKIGFRRARVLHGGHWKFLTVWALASHCVHYALATITTIVNGHADSRDRSLVSRFTDACFFGVSFPAGMIVSALFWSLYHIDRQLVFPAGFAQFYPTWLNHGVHTLPVLMNVASLALVRRRATARRPAHFLLLTFILSYLCWTLYLGVAHDYWVYGVMQVLSWSGRAALMLGSCVMSLLFSELGRALNSARWRSTTEAQHSKRS